MGEGREGCPTTLRTLPVAGKTLKINDFLYKLFSLTYLCHVLQYYYYCRIQSKYACISLQLRPSLLFPSCHKWHFPPPSPSTIVRTAYSAYSRTDEMPRSPAPAHRGTGPVRLARICVWHFHPKFPPLCHPSREFITHQRQAVLSHAPRLPYLIHIPPRAPCPLP